MMKIIRLPQGPLQTNCYIVSCEETRQAAVIDPAWDGRALITTLNQHGWDLAHILLTHAHFDHVGGLAYLKEYSAAPIYLHEEAVPMLESASITAAMTMGMQFPQPPPPDEFLQEGQVIQIGNSSLEVLYTPGHAPGHVSFYCPADHALFSGDVLFEGSIGRTDLPGGHHETLLRVIKEKLFVLPDETQVFSGHGRPTTIGLEKATNPFLKEA